MKRALVLAALLLSAAGYIYLQTTAPVPKLSTFMPSGALLCLEASDFARLLGDWDQSKVKADWLESGNYSVFSRSNLYTKLAEVYGQYGEAAGFLPGLPGIRQIAGTDSALALYGIRDVEFLYISRIAESDLLKSQLWAVRDKFEQRQAGGVAFYLRTAPASRRTVAFAFTKGLLLVATRDDLVAQSLELLAGGGNPSIASDRWYRDASAAAPNSGELRLVMNLEALVKSDYFRSYWVERNVSAVRRYSAGVADVTGSGGVITESRVFLHASEPSPSERSPANAVVSPDLLALVPPEAGLYRASAITDASEIASLIVQKLVGPEIEHTRDWRYAPMAISPDQRAGSEADLETRIDEQPLPADAGTSDSQAAVRAMVEKAGARSVLLLEASAPVAGTFVSMGSVVVLEAPADWDRDSVRLALGAAAGKLWTTSQLGAGWVGGTSGRHPVERLDGLGALMFGYQGRLLFVSNDSRLLAAALDRVGTVPSPGSFTYSAGFRHLRERPNFERVMKALDFAPAGGSIGMGIVAVAGGPPSFFSGNIASLSGVLAQVDEVRVTEEERGPLTVQTVVYR